MLAGKRHPLFFHFVTAVSSPLRKCGSAFHALSSPAPAPGWWEAAGSYLCCSCRGGGEQFKEWASLDVFSSWLTDPSPNPNTRISWALKGGRKPSISQQRRQGQRPQMFPLQNPFFLSHFWFCTKGNLASTLPTYFSCSRRSQWPRTDQGVDSREMQPWGLLENAV